MPALIQGNNSQHRTVPASQAKQLNAIYRDRYPAANFVPGNPAHDRLLSEVLSRANESASFMQQKHSTWDEVQKLVNVFIPASNWELTEKQRDAQHPMSIVVPESYATLETLLTYMLAVFGESPVFKYAGTGPEDVVGAILLEKIIETQVRKSKALLALHSQWRDAFIYGIGIVAVNWTMKLGRRSVLDELGYYDDLGAFIRTGTERVVIDSVMYEGSELVCIDPRRYLPDPAVPIYEPQKGGYVGWITTETLNQLLNAENSFGSIGFNGKILEETNGDLRSSVYQSYDNATGASNISESTSTKRVDSIYMYMELNPKEYGFSQKDAIEKWLVRVSGDSIITAAAPMDLHHEMFPVAVAAPDYGGHEMLPIAHLELMYGLNKVMNFYYNSHVCEVVANIRNRIVFDPKAFSQTDVFSQTPGHPIRARKPVFGKNLKDSIFQLSLSDMTRGHMQDLMQSRAIGREVTGAVDAMQGVQRTKGERVTAEEFSSTRAAAVSKLQKIARIISMQSMYDTALMMAYNTQQFLSEETYVNIAGRWEEELRTEYGFTDRMIRVSPYDLNCAFDVSISDGTVEGGEMADKWLQALQIGGSIPEVAAAMDLPRVFLHIARMLKAQNASDFLKKTGGGPQAQVLPDAEVAAQEKAGNVVAMPRERVARG